MLTKAQIIPKRTAKNRPIAGIDVKDCVGNCINNREKNPGAAKDDRLHRVKTHKTVALFEHIKDDAADQRNTGNRRGDVRRQTGRVMARLPVPGLGGGAGGIGS